MSVPTSQTTMHYVVNKMHSNILPLKLVLIRNHQVASILWPSQMLQKENKKECHNQNQTKPIHDITNLKIDWLLKNVYFLEQCFQSIVV